MNNELYYKFKNWCKEKCGCDMEIWGLFIDFEIELEDKQKEDEIKRAINKWFPPINHLTPNEYMRIKNEFIGKCYEELKLGGYIK